MSDSTVRQLIESSVAVKSKILSDAKLVFQISAAAAYLIDCAKGSGLIMACGNGGSACDAVHLVEELVARYKRERRGIRAMHLLDPAVLTCWSNDYSFDDVFARQVETFGTKNDILVAFSTSGKSPNILKAAESAKSRGVKIIALTGKDGGMLAKLADIPLIVPSNDTERIQESHLTIVHIFCELIELAITD